jgi:hypothetical protein
MKNKGSEGPLFQWKFSLLDESPGPSEGDAGEFIECLGLDQWSFFSLDLVAESTVGDRCLSEFAVRGSLETLNRLRDLHDAATKSCSNPPQPVSGSPANLVDPVSAE